MQSQYMILNYATNSIIRWLTCNEVLAICKALMAMPNPSFDIVSSNLNFVTTEFEECPDKSWKHAPMPMSAEVKK